MLAINAVMFGVEVVAGLLARSTAFQADSLDFSGDAANYALSLGVLGLAASMRARAAPLKGLTMGAFGAWVLGLAAWNIANSIVPEAPTMGTIGTSPFLRTCFCYRVAINRGRRQRTDVLVFGVIRDHSANAYAAGR